MLEKLTSEQVAELTKYMIKSKLRNYPKSGEILFNLEIGSYKVVNLGSLHMKAIYIYLDPKRGIFEYFTINDKNKCITFFDSARISVIGYSKVCKLLKIR